MQTRKHNITLILTLTQQDPVRPNTEILKIISVLGRT